MTESAKMSEVPEKRLRKIVEAYADVIAPLAKESILEAADALSALREKLAAVERSEASWEETRKAVAELRNDNGALRVRAEAAEARATAAEAREVTPEMLAAAWCAWHSRHGGRMGPGPAFKEAIEAALAVANG